MLRRFAYPCFLMLLVAVVPASLPAAEVTPREGIVIEDLPYGYVLYEYYQEDYFTALTQLLVEEHFNRIDDHAAEAELLRGGLMLSYGMHREATPIFEKLLAGNFEPTLQQDKKALFSEQQLRDRAWFFLGKVLFQRGYMSEAAEALGRCGKYLPAHLSAERDALLSQALLDSNQLEAAETLVANWQGAPSWKNYAAYNLGVALVRENRLADAVVYLEPVGNGPADTEEMQSLRDRANLALGFGWLREENGEQAKLALERVRLNGPFSNAALLGYGWAAAALGDYSAALVPWLELRDRNSNDPAYQESLLAIPYAYRKLSANQQAAESYELAIAVYDAEMAHLDQAIANARSGELTRQLIDPDVDDFSRWNWSLSDLPDVAESQYLYEVIATNQFQAGLRNYRDLIMLERHLAEWRGRLASFGDIVDSRRTAYAMALQRLPDDLYAAEIQSHQDRYQQLTETLAEAASERNVSVVANAQQLSIGQRVKALEGASVLAAADPEAREKLRLLKGLLNWDLERDYKYRMWQQQRDMEALERALNSSQAEHSRFVGQLTAIPAQLDDFDVRAQGLAPRVDELIAAVAELAVAQVAELGDIAAVELIDRRDRVQQYRTQAQFAQAAIYDSSRASAEPTQ